MKKIIDISLAALITALTAACAYLFTDINSIWFQTLTKPDFYPDPVVFIVARAVIYIISAITLAYAFGAKDKKAAVLMLINYILQIIRYLAFFTLEMPLTALFIVIVEVVISNIITVNLIDKNEFQGWLYFVVFVWTVFAAIINYALVMLN
ncbi:MAG: tryptophan-rich sensory protein [Christensenellales bacterium]|jgi:benzodiazapine receptor